MKTKIDPRWTNLGIQVLAIIAALGFTTLILLISGAPHSRLTSN